MKLKIVFASLFVSSWSIAFVYDAGTNLTTDSLNQLIKDNDITNVQDLVPLLPTDMRLNFVLKHGIKRQGERGHLIEEKVSQSADPNLPRAILWNEKTGFTLSYNGGGPAQTANNRLDVLTFDNENKKFQLQKVDFPLTEEQIHDQATSAVVADASCQECHGPQQRPIFAMYPDWPSFYGSDNDELNNPKAPHQVPELQDYKNFRAQTVPHSLRYSPLYDGALVQKAYGMPMWSTFPYRQNTSEVKTDISRAFSFRPALRLGVVYGRLNAQAVFKSMKSHKDYDKYAPFVLHSLLQCRWLDSYPQKVQAYYKDVVKKDLGATPVWYGNNRLQLQYQQLWTLLGLKINDVDIRYSYNHKGYANMDSSQKIMEPGYIGTYFNAYFDGTATADELLAGKLLADLETKYPTLKGAYHLRGLAEKYKHLEKRYVYDERLFKNYDSLGLWFSMPFPQLISEPHHREIFTDEMNQDYQTVCRKTVEILQSQMEHPAP